MTLADNSYIVPLPELKDFHLIFYAQPIYKSVFNGSMDAERVLTGEYVKPGGEKTDQPTYEKHFDNAGELYQEEILQIAHRLMRAERQLSENMNKAWLGNATTGELLAELIARAEVAGYDKYKTVQD